MKALTYLALIAALSGGAISVQAAGQNEPELDSCKAELQAYYGEDTELMLVDRRHNPHGTRFRVAVRLDADNAYFATCWVPRLEEGRFAYDDDKSGPSGKDSVLVSR